ncbi:hypothetical protein F441_20827 [Phytophthora nicotianae CJ01A1]|nr:hypothetical protein F441_20827 [Phytophthora nicotianae CJ01A1]
MLTHALDPDYIDNYGYSCMRSLLESTGALDTEAKEGSRLSEVALAPVRKDVMTKRDVPDTRVGDETKDPWKKICFHYRIKHLQDRVYADINKGTYQVTEPPSLTKAELDNDDWSDFEDEDGNPTAYPPGTLDPDAREGDGDEAGDDEGSPDTSDAELKAKLNQ